MPTHRTTASNSYVLVFDGGSINNPAFGYGSYRLTDPQGHSHLRRLEFGRGISNNQAEYMALIAGLRGLVSKLDEAVEQGPDVDLEVRGDSQLVINQLAGRWKVRHPRIAPLFQEARKLLSRFSRTKLVWTPRAESVAILGH